MCAGNGIVLYERFDSQIATNVAGSHITLNIGGQVRHRTDSQFDTVGVDKVVVLAIPLDTAVGQDQSRGWIFEMSMKLLMKNASRIGEFSPELKKSRNPRSLGLSG